MLVSLVTGPSDFRVFFFGEVGIPHNFKVGSVPASEIDISHAHFDQPLHPVVGMVICRLGQGVAKGNEPFYGNLCQQRFLVSEVPVWRRHTHAGETGGVAEGEPLHAVFRNQLESRLDESCAQIPVMIGVFACLGLRFCGGLLHDPGGHIFILHNVNSPNIHVSLFYMHVEPSSHEGIQWRRRLHDSFAAAPALTVYGFLMAADLAFTGLSLLVDHRVITGAPAWLKPFKFALSTMIAAWSFAVCIAAVRRWPRTVRALDWLLAAALGIEILLIDLQAARGTTSHFNFATAFDAWVFAVMGVSIAVVWLSMLLLTIALFLQPFAGSAWGWSLRLGMMLALIGTGSGFLMTVPTPQQLAAARESGRLPIGGAHTVGAPDGGRGLPVTNWSADHGDLRIAHFVGMHGLQLLPFLAWWSGRRERKWGEPQRVRLVFASFVSYLTLFTLLLWQAFRGQSIAAPDASSVTAYTVWLLLSVAAFVWIERKPAGMEMREGTI